MYLHRNPQNANKIKIPGFDKSRYGQPVGSHPGQQVSDPDIESELPQAQSSVSSLSKRVRINNNDETSSPVNGSEKEVRKSSHPHPYSNPQQFHTNHDSHISSTMWPDPVTSRKTRKLNLASYDQNSQMVNQKNDRSRKSFGQNADVADRRQERELSDSRLNDEDDEESQNNKLMRLQADELREINYRNRAKGHDTTTSLEDLAVARRGIKSRTATPISSLQSTYEVAYAQPNHRRGSSNQFAERDDRMLDRRFSGEKKPVKEEALPNHGYDYSQQNPQSSSSEWDYDTIQRRYDMIEEKETLQEMQNRIAAVEPVPPAEKPRNQKWATKSDLKASDAETNSNAWGSDAQSDDLVAEDEDSVNAVQNGNQLKTFQPELDYGKMFKKKSPEFQSSLVGWDGNMQPPPADWEGRGTINNKTPEARERIDNWALRLPDLKAIFVKSSITFEKLPEAKVLNMDLQPDGLDLIPRQVTLNINNVSRYGYTSELADLTAFCQPVTENDWDDWGKLDLDDEYNRDHAEDCLEDTLSNWIEKCLPRWQARNPSPTTILHADYPARPSAREALLNYQEAAPNLNKPKVNIYIRPAVPGDIQQIVTLYNWYILNTPRTAEFEEINNADMRLRLDEMNTSRLPFIVAVSRNKRQSKSQEQVVGFACAQDFTAADLVERISAEIEVYIHHQWLQKGVGRCLLDKLLEVTDRGYVAKGGYEFRCAPELATNYVAGGARDIHAVIMVIRHWKTPRVGKNWARPKDLDGEPNPIAEDDFIKWVQPWLVEQWGFEDQGCLKGVGAKFGRFLNMSYLVKETKWQPMEGKIPEYFAPLEAGQR